MTTTHFFRLLHISIEAKGDALAEHIAALNATGAAEETYTLDPFELSLIPRCPFAYWTSQSVRKIFAALPQVEAENRAARIGDHPGDKERYVRLFWEAPTPDQNAVRQWLPYQKGGHYSPFYADTHLVVDWDVSRQTYYDFHGRPGRSSEHPSNYLFFFRPGVNWPLRTQKGLNVRAMPSGSIISNKSPTVFVPNNEIQELLALLAIMNSCAFRWLVELQMAFGSYEVGVIQRTPIPHFASNPIRRELVRLAIEAHDIQRDRDLTDETTHAFCLPGLVAHRDAPSLREAGAALDVGDAARQSRLAVIQAQIDDIVFNLYGLNEDDRALVRWETGIQQFEVGEEGVEDEEEAGEEAASPQDPITRVQDLLMWCVGVAFGRWDVRKALTPSLLPLLGGPFDPLPRYAPGALIDDPAGIQTPIENYRSQIPSDGILVDDPTHPSDIMRRVREVLELLWGNRADAIENEACEILGVKSLREYFRDPRRFFAYHIKRYSKSRRKAPIYWLLQSERRSYGIWLYYHRITPMTLYIAGRDYADGKIALERGRLDDLRTGLEALNGTARRNREREIERQEKLVAEVTAFGKTLDKLALANLPPDPNDGVLISIAPLHPLVPWSEAARMWEALRSGQYSWSTMAKRMVEGSGR